MLLEQLLFFYVRYYYWPHILAYLCKLQNKENRKTSLGGQLLSDAENRKHLKNFRNVDCVLTNHSKVQDNQANLKTTNL